MVLPPCRSSPFQARLESLAALFGVPLGLAVQLVGREGMGQRSRATHAETPANVPDTDITGSHGHLRPPRCRVSLLSPARPQPPPRCLPDVPFLCMLRLTCRGTHNHP
jgi:hypothetical protein